MVVRVKSTTEFEDQISESIESRDVTIDTRIGSIKDLFISPFSEVFKSQHDEIVYLSQLVSLKNAARVNPDDLDAYVYNEELLRWTGSASLAVVTFARIQPPTVNISIPANFPVSTIEDPETGNTVDFRTIESKIMYGPLAVPSSAYYNAATERYEIDVACASVLRGVDTSVGAYTITQFKRSFPEFDAIYNKQSATPGRGLETNEELAERYLMKIEGSKEGTSTGLARFVLDSFSGVVDVYVVYGENEALIREQDDAGAVDAWILGEALLTASYDTRYVGIETLIPVDRQPLDAVTAVSSLGVPYVEGVDYEVVKGEGIYAYSNRGQDGIRFLSTGTHPNIGDVLHIEYRYNSLINVITAYYRQPDYFVMGSDVLFRWAQPQYLEIEANLKVKSGNPEDVLNLVRTRILNYINGLKLGENLEEFDLDSEVSRVYGVDNWTYVVLAEKGLTGVSDIEIDPNEYARIEASDLVINLVT